MSAMTLGAKLALAAGIALTPLGVVEPLKAQVVPLPSPGTDSVTVIPGAYGASALYAWLMGSGYRSLWTTPIRVPVANLDDLGGGLTPMRLGGGMTTRTLHMRGADGRRYVFRSVDKTPSDLMQEFEGTPLQAILQDQISSFHPSGAPVVARLLDAVGVLHPDPQYLVVPNDPRLGEFRDEFAGMLVLFEERPDDGPDGTPGFADSREIVELRELFDILETGPEHRVDVVELLRVRMVDLLVGDRDRSHNNHLWARIEEGGVSRWRVIPRDRDQAFVRIDGLLKTLARKYEPRLVTFSEVYPNIDAVTRNAWDMDRNLLVSMDRETWLSVVEEVGELLTDEVIADAARQMPPEHYAVFGEELTRSLRLRRDHLPEAAQRLYEIVFGHADVHATDRAEQFRIERQASGAVSLTFGLRGGSATSFARTFDPAETSEIRLYMHGGDDRAVSRGPASPILVRLIGGGGADRFDGEARGSIVYDDVSDSEYADGLGARVEDRRAPRPYSWFEEERTLDWGLRWIPEPRVSYDADRGLVLLTGAKIDRYGFLKDPYSSRTRFGAGLSLGLIEPFFDLSHLRRSAIGSADLRLSGRWSGIEIIDYYGPGNERGTPGPVSYHRVPHKQVTLSPVVSLGDGEEKYFEVGPIFRHTFTDTTKVDDSFVADTDPYGSGKFTQVGLQASFQFDSRDMLGTPGSGYFVQGGGSVYPQLFDVDQGAFGELHGEAAGYLSPEGGNPTLAVRVGGKKVWGVFPFAESAFLGGSRTVRGLREQRYAGHASVYGSAEFRVFLLRTLVLAPADLGLFALANIGRVYSPGESSSKLHNGVGGGIWLAPVRRSSTVQFSLARSEGRTGFYLGLGFAF